MGYIFTKTNANFRSFSDPQKLAPKLVSNTPNVDIDVISNFPWTLTPLNSLAIQQTPYIRLREFYLLDSYINQAFQAYGIKITDWSDFFTAVGSGLYADYNDTRLYEGLYDHKDETGFVYKLPYFSETYLQTLNSWIAKPFYNEIVKMQQDVVGFAGTAGGIGLGGLGSMLRAGAAFLLRRYPVALAVSVIAGDVLTDYGPGAFSFLTKTAQKGYYVDRLTEQVKRSLVSPIGDIGGIDPVIDKPFLWNNTTPRTFEISFPLYNTLTAPQGQNWDSQIVKNWEFCYLLSYQNLFNKRNLFTGIPPVFYEIDIPGVHYSKAGYISNLRISNIGNIRAMNLTVNNTQQTVNVPDAYYINFTITDFFMPSKNFMSSLGNTEKGILDDDINEGLLTSTVEINEPNPPPPVITPAGPITPEY